MHSGLARFVKVFYILIRRLISERSRPSAGFDLSITTEFRFNAAAKTIKAVPRLNDALTAPDGKSAEERTRDYAAYANF